MRNNPSLYDKDPLLWSEQQVDVLRRRAFAELDLENVIDEIESVGLSELKTVISHLRWAMTHELKIIAWPKSRDVPHWQAESRSRRDDAIDTYTPSMVQRIDVEQIYQRAKRALPETLDDVSPLPVPEHSPWTLDDLLKE